MDNNVDRLERTLYVSNMAEGVDEEMVYEVFVEVCIILYLLSIMFS